jgi:hypothetical protein
VRAMKRYSATDIVMAAAIAAVFLFLFSLALGSRPQPGPTMFDLAGVGTASRELP